MSARSEAPVPRRVHDPVAARRAYGPLADVVFANLQVGDPLADAACEALAALPHAEGTRLVDALLSGDTADAPEAVAALIEHCLVVPDWVDWERVENGARTYRRLGLLMVAVLASVSLLRGYHSSAVNKPLAFADRIESAARSRLGETGRFVLDVSRAGGLRRDGDGFRNSIRVRLMHAQVRRRLLASDRWDSAWGVPINQSDVAATGLSFSIAVIYAAREMGFSFTVEETEDVLHVWRYVAHLMGLEPELHWTTEHEARTLGELVGTTQPGADAWSVRLATSLRGVLREVRGEGMLPERMFLAVWCRYLDGLARELNGPGFADDLGIGPGLPVPALFLTRRIVRPLERARRWIPGGTRAMAKVGELLIERSMNQLLRDRVPTYARPQDAAPGLRTRGPTPPARPPPPAFEGAIYGYRK